MGKRECGCVTGESGPRTRLICVDERGGPVSV